MAKIPPLLKQIWISSGVILNLLGIGLLLSYPYCLLPALKAPTSTIAVNLELGSWIASSSSMSVIAGMLLSSYLMQRFGRKMAHIFLMIPSILGWIIIYFANNITTIMIGRRSEGVGKGSGLILGCTVIAEYTRPEYRGVLIGVKTAALCVGNLIMHVMSKYFDWRTIAALSVIPSLIVLCNIITWPESPMWLASNGNYKDSETVFYWLRGEDEKSKRKLKALLRSQAEKGVHEPNLSTFRVKALKFFRIIKRKDIYKPLILTVFGFILLESSGRHSFPVFASDIIGGIQGSKNESFWFTLTIDAIITISSFMSCLLSRFLKRRFLLFISGAVSIVILFSISLCMLLVSSGHISNERSYIPLSLLVLYFVISNLGCASLPFTLFGEIYPLAHKGFGTAVGGIMSSVPMALLLKITPSLLENFKVQGTFAVYGLSMTVSLIYLYFALPETHNKTLQEIEDFFNGKTSQIENKICSNEDERLEMISLRS